jgi:formamidopyrimidine-DNA glycosylase
LRRLVLGKQLEEVRLVSPFVLRSFDPPPAALSGRTVESISRMGKRIVFGFEGGFHLVVHLMIAGRFVWKAPLAGSPGKIGLALFRFENGTLILTEASSKKRASIHVVHGDHALSELDPGGLEVLIADRDAFEEALRRENHTLKRALTDPKIFSGIGNAYSDEILHRARLSPMRLTSQMTLEQVTALFEATRSTLLAWTARLTAKAGDDFPKKVTAFHAEMAVHGKYKKPCPDCGCPVQRIAYAENESNYCASCQTGGKLLADRALSRLLKGDWPKSLDELEQRKKTHAERPTSATNPASSPAAENAEAAGSKTNDSKTASSDARSLRSSARRKTRSRVKDIG